MIEPFYWGERPPDNSVFITHPSRESLLTDISDRMQSRRGFTVATVNLDHCVKLQSDADFRRAYQAHSHVVADGNPIVWLSRLAGNPVSLVPGSELIAPLAAMAAQNEVPVALLGATPEALSAASDALITANPKLKVVAEIAPPFGFDPNGSQADDCIDRIRASGARLCFLALGAPKQEVFAVRAASALPECGFASIGAGLDFIAGSQKRAPIWVRKLALEWLWRLAGNPTRLARRYGACIAILPRLAIDARNQRVS